MLECIKKLCCHHIYDEAKVETHYEGRCLNKKKIEITFCTKCEKKRKRTVLVPEEHDWKSYGFEIISSPPYTLLPQRGKKEVFMCRQCKEIKDVVLYLNYLT
jgi:hypothetical protein